MIFLLLIGVVTPDIGHCMSAFWAPKKVWGASFVDRGWFFLAASTRGPEREYTQFFALF